MRKTLLILAACLGLYQACGYLSARKEAPAAEAFLARHPLDPDSPPTQAGFVSVLMPSGVDPDVMTVFTPESCPLEAGVRGRALVARMKAARIPVTTSSHAEVQVQAKDQAEARIKQKLLGQLAAIMGGETPIVFYQGRAKNNPTFEDVQREFATAK